jgi:hypothetical protein
MWCGHGAVINVSYLFNIHLRASWIIREPNGLPCYTNIKNPCGFTLAHKDYKYTYTRSGSI